MVGGEGGGGSGVSSTDLSSLKPSPLYVPCVLYHIITHGGKIYAGTRSCMRTGEIASKKYVILN